jgi:acetolactate synthase-1/2/3 large subunit
VTVSEEEDLDASLDRFLKTEGPCLMICQVHPDVSTTD